MGVAKQPVLILGVEPRISVPIARSLHQQGIPVAIAGLSPQDPRISSRAVVHFLRLPGYQDQAAEFLEALSSFIRTQGVDMLIPATDAALSAVSQHYDALSPLLHVACPPPHIVNRVLHKEATLAAAQQCGIRVPREFVISTAKDLETLLENLTFPVVAKPRQKSSAEAFKVRYFRSEADLSEALTTGALGEALLQEYCPGEGVGVEMLLHQGECVAAFQHRRLKELPHTGGVAVVAIAEPLDPELRRTALALLRGLEWQGVAMVEFRDDRIHGTAALMEVNGRYWGTLALPIHAGVDFPRYQWQLAHGEQPDVPSSYNVGMRWRWSAGYLRRLHAVFLGSLKPNAAGSSLRKDLFSSPFDLAPSVRDAIWDWSDPMAALTELYRTVKGLASSDLRAVTKRALPRSVVSPLQSYKRLGGRERSVYIRMRLLRALGLHSDRKRKIPLDARRLVFICHGNIMRSPVSEALFKQFASDCDQRGISIISAGLNAVPGRSANPRAMKVAREFGILLDNHRAQLLAPSMVEQADVIFAMDYENEALVRARYPQSAHKVFMLSAYADESYHRVEIPDPYWGDEAEVRRCYRILDGCIHNLAKSLFPDWRSDSSKARELSTSI